MALHFLIHCLIPSIAVMLTSYLTILFLFRLFKVGKPSLKVIFLTLPLLKSLSLLILGTPEILRNKPKGFVFGIRFPDPYHIFLLPDFFSFGEVNWKNLYLIDYIFGGLVLVVLVTFLYRFIGLTLFYQHLKNLNPLSEQALTQNFFPSLLKDLKGLPKIVLTEEETITSPFTIGLLKPVIVFPLSLWNHLKKNKKMLRAVLAHELAHIKRKDYLLNWFLAFACNILFFSPFTKKIIKEIYQSVEEACDEWAIKQTDKKRLLVDAILEAARFMSFRKPKKTPALSNTFLFLSQAPLEKELLQRRVMRAETLTFSPQKERTFWHYIKILFLALFVLFFLLGQLTIGIPLGNKIFLLH